MFTECETLSIHGNDLFVPSYTTIIYREYMVKIGQLKPQNLDTMTMENNSIFAKF